MTTKIKAPELTPELAELRQKLSVQQCKFVDALFGPVPMKAGEAYRLAYDPDMDMETACSAASRALNRLPAVSAFVRAMKRRDWESNSLSREEKRSFLADAVRVPVSDIIDASGAVVEKYAHLVQEIQHSTDRDGNPVTKVKLIGKAEAIRIDNQMAGHDAPTEIRHSFSGILSSVGSSVGLPSAGDADDA